MGSVSNAPGAVPVAAPPSGRARGAAEPPATAMRRDAYASRPPAKAPAPAAPTHAAEKTLAAAGGVAGVAAGLGQVVTMASAPSAPIMIFAVLLTATMSFGASRLAGHLGGLVDRAIDRDLKPLSLREAPRLAFGGLTGAAAGAFGAISLLEPMMGVGAVPLALIGGIALFTGIGGAAWARDFT